MKNKRLILDTISWLLVTLAVVLSIFQAIDYKTLINLNSPGARLVLLVSVIFVFMHGIRRYGGGKLLIFFLITVIMVYLTENISILTGFPLGKFHYSDILAVPNIINVPVTIPLPAFPVIYLSWTMASIILDCFTGKPIGKNVVAIPVVAAFIFAMWDAFADQHFSTSVGLWIFDEGGAHFGVPFICVFGMFLYAYIICQIFSVFLFKFCKKEAKEANNKPDRNFLLQAILVYLTYPITYLLAGFFVPDKIITSVNNHSWYLRDLYQSSGIVAFVTAGFVIVIALIKLINLRNQKEEN